MNKTPKKRKSILGSIRMWFYNQSLKDPDVVNLIEKQREFESIGYNLWVLSLNKTGYPKNSNGSWMDCWQLYDYFIKSNKKDTYIQHTKTRP